MSDLKMSLKSWRMARGISQNEMAILLNVHVNTYINYEKTPEKIDVKTAIKICDILRVDFADVIFLSENTTEM